MLDEILISIESIGDDCCLELGNAREYLSEKEIGKAEAFRFEKHRNRYTRGRGLLRKQVGDLLSLCPSKVVIEEEERGKPFLSEQELSFNLSHTDDLAIFAFSKDLERIGIDIEMTNRDADIIGLSKHYFSEKEFKIVNSLVGTQQKIAFFKIWTAKEARMKLTGEGLYLDPKEIEVKFCKTEPSGFVLPKPSNQILRTIYYNQFGAIASIVADRNFEVTHLGSSR